MSVGSLSPETSADGCRKEFRAARLPKGTQGVSKPIFILRVYSLDRGFQAAIDR